MRLLGSLLAVLLLAPLAQAWVAGHDRPHHADISEAAAERLPAELRQLILTHRDAFRRGALDPDGVTDQKKGVHTFYHTFEPGKGSGGGVYRIELSLHEAVVAMRQGAAPEEVAYQLGFLTHFATDLAVPFHTGEDLYDHAWHEPYEHAAYDHRNEYTARASREPREVHDPSAYAKEVAKESAAMGEALVAALDASGGVWSPEVRDITERAASLALEAAADLMYTAYVRADPARPEPTFDAQMPLPTEPEDVGLSIRELRKHHPALIVGFFAALAALAVATVLVFAKGRKPSG